jgi:hypothetical protein
MRSTRTLESSLMLSDMIIVVLGCFTVFSAIAGAQTQGNNDVFDVHGNQKGSSAFIDAKALPPGADFCDTIYSLLTGVPGYPVYPAAGAVIDARGISGTALTCTLGSPWLEGTTYANVPSTILLPAGTITISSTWALPSSTRVLGEGSADPLQNGIGSTSSQQTTIQACNPTGSCFNGSAMIQLGDNCPTPSCMAVSIEDVTLNGGNQTIDGIVNSASQDLSYAKNVVIYDVLGPGLKISGNANNSGPYANITYDTGGLNGTACASIYNVAGGTHGLHGVTCISSNDSSVAILLDSSNNTLEDIRIAGFTTGIYVGSRGTAQSNVAPLLAEQMPAAVALAVA